MQKIRKEKVNEAIELLWLDKRSGPNGKTEAAEENSEGRNTQCKIMHYHRKSEKQHSIAFSKHVILSEMKSHVTRRDWSKVRNLFLLLLRCSTDIEPLIWRYSFILTLYSNIDNLSNTSQFLKMCVGSLDSYRDSVLRNLLLLSPHK